MYVCVGGGYQRARTEENGGVKRKGEKERGGGTAKGENKLSQVLKAKKCMSYLDQCKISGKTRV